MLPLWPLFPFSRKYGEGFEQRTTGQKNYVEVQLTELSKLYPQLNDTCAISACARL